MRKSLVVLAALGATLAAQAQVLYSTGFEGPTFTPGALAGQSGWAVTTLTFGATTGTNFAVAGNAAKNGSQGVRLDTSPIPSSRLARQVISYNPNGGMPVLEVSASIQIQPRANLSDPTDTSGYGIFVSALSGSTRVRLAQISLFAADSNFAAELSLSTRSEGTFGGLVSSTLTPVNNTWYDLVLSLDFSKRIATGTINGQSLGLALPFDDLPVEGAGLASAVLGYDQGIYDDFSVEAVPEPATLAGLALGVAALARRRRK